MNEYVGEQAHMLLWRAGVPQKQLAEVIGVTQSTLSKKMRGTVPWTVEELVAAADFLGVDPGVLLPRKDSNLQPAGYGYGLVAVAA